MLIADGFALIGLLVYALVKATVWIKQFEQRFLEKPDLKRLFSSILFWSIKY
jgi:hypothetical protein